MIALNDGPQHQAPEGWHLAFYSRAQGCRYLVYFAPGERKDAGSHDSDTWWVAVTKDERPQYWVVRSDTGEGDYEYDQGPYPSLEHAKQVAETLIGLNVKKEDVLRK